MLFVSFNFLLGFASSMDRLCAWYDGTSMQFFFNRLPKKSGNFGLFFLFCALSYICIGSFSLVQILHWKPSLLQVCTWLCTWTMDVAYTYWDHKCKKSFLKLMDANINFLFWQLLAIGLM